MKQSTQKVLTVILGVLSFPFFCSRDFQWQGSAVPEKQPELEAFLAAAVAAEIPEEYPYEAVKAQVILVSKPLLRERRAGRIDGNGDQGAGAGRKECGSFQGGVCAL